MTDTIESLSPAQHAMVISLLEIAADSLWRAARRTESDNSRAWLNRQEEQARIIRAFLVSNQNQGVTP